MTRTGKGGAGEGGPATTQSPSCGTITRHRCLVGWYIWHHLCYKIGVLFPLKQLTSLFKALGDPTRLRVVNLLHAQCLCVRDLQQVLGLSQPLVSRHLAILRATSLVRTQRQGARVCYSLSRAPFLNYPLSKFLSEIVPFFPELQADVQKLAELKGDSMLKSEGSGSFSDLEGPTAQPSGATEK
jgi:ArsR family transcriptional regulator